MLRRRGDAEGARAAYQQAIDSGDPDAAPRAALGLGDLLRERGDVEGAQTAYQTAIDSNRQGNLPSAAHLGLVLKERDLAFVLQEEQEGTDEMWAPDRQTIGSGPSDYAAVAAVRLGILLDERGDVEGARAAYQLAIDSGHPDAAPRAALGLGILLAGRGDVDGARAAW